MDHFTIIMGGVKEAVEGTPVEEVKAEEKPVKAEEKERAEERKEGA